MGDQMRMTGLFSGLDTESIIQSLISVKSQKVTTLKQDQQKLEWKQKAWQDLNSKVYGFYSGTLSSMRLSGAYAKKSTKVSDPTKASVVASDTAVNGSQKLKVTSLASSGYLTGAKLDRKEVITKETDADGNETEKKTYENWKSDDTLKSVLGADDITGQSFKVTVGTGENAKETVIELNNAMTIQGFVNQLKEAGVNANFDEKNQRFFVSSKAPGADNEFSIFNESGDNLKKLGLDTEADYGTDNQCTKVAASDAVIELNDAVFTSNTNTFTINGLTITASALTDEPVYITTETDYNGIYDMIKDMLTEYNEIINDVNTKYNADSARKFNMLSEEEKEAMTDDEVEKWENTIKDSLLRRDKDLYSVMNILTESMTNGVEKDGVRHYLSDYGIGTLSYFEAEENDRKSYHIDGDSDDEKTASKDDKLKKAIAENPEETIAFFAGLCNNLYTKLGETMKRSEYRSIYKIYDDKSLQKDYDSYTTKISEAQSKLDDYEDRWYDKFSKMEVALSKLQSNQNSLAGMLGQ